MARRGGRPAHDEFELAAESYLAQVGGVDSAEFLAEPIFFATIDYSEATLEIFRRFQLSSVPFHAIVPAGSDTQLVLKRGFTSPSVRTADDVAKFVALRLKFDLRVARPLGPVIARSAGMVVGGYLLVFKALPAFYRNPFNPMIAFALSLAVFFLSMSGLVYNLIRTPASVARARSSTSWPARARSTSPRASLSPRSSCSASSATLVSTKVRPLFACDLVF